jgi:(R,R)-butanediol dehydrogenase / meso-butanediol dehydrogenase / diacetyl reductase
VRAIRWHGRTDVRVEDVDDAPAPTAHEVRISVEWCGICGTDLEEYRSGPIVIATEPHPITGQTAPMVIGHEVAGRVDQVGSSVVGLAPGDAVAIDGILPCGACPACARHEVQLCPRLAAVGMSWPGGLAERLTVPSYTVVRAVNASTQALALAEPLSVAVRALRRGRLQAGERLVVLGAGTIGLSVLQAAKAGGCGQVLVVDPIEMRRELALRLGAATALGPDDDVIAALASSFEEGADLVLECSGRPGTPRLATRLARAGGRVVLVGLPATAEPFKWLQVVLREIEVIGSVGHVYDEDFVDAVRMIDEGVVDPTPLVTHRLPLERAVTDGIAPLASGERTDAIKVLISPSAVFDG